MRWGLCPHAPGIYRFVANSMCGVAGFGGAAVAAPPCRHLRQRSGRIPASPYPLLKHFHFISNSSHCTERALARFGLLPPSRRIIQRTGF